MISRRLIVGAGVALTAAQVRAFAAPSDQLDAKSLQADVVQLGAALAALHPGLLRYQSEKQFRARLAALERACDRPLTLAAFYLEVARFLATIRCGHSYPNFYNQSDAVQAALFARRDRLPFAFRWLGADMVVTAGFASGLAPGTSIETIDGRPAAAVLAALLPLVRADGHNDAKRRALLSVTLDDDFETFDIFYSLRFGGGPRYDLTVRDPGGHRRRISVAAIDLAERRAQRPPHGDTKGADPFWTMTRTGRTAVLTMNDWSVYDSKWNWRGWLDAQFDRIAQDDTTGLVIDLRANEGGNDCGDPIVARLIDRPVATRAAERLVRYRRVPDALRPVLRTWDKSFYDWGERAVPRDARYLTLRPEEPASDAIRPAGKRFRSKVAVLIGPQNSSATFNFASLVQREQLAVLVGEPTGGNQRGINGGAFFNVRLPASKIEVDLPLIASFPPGHPPDAGLLPDLAVPLTRAAIASGDDAVLRRALAAVT